MPKRTLSRKGSPVVTKRTPNVRRLVAFRMAALAIPVGSPDPIAAGAQAILQPGRLAALDREASAWVDNAIALVRQAAEPNPWKELGDEEIAGEILRWAEAEVVRENDKKKKP